MGPAPSTATVLILSAGIGEGHDAPARELAAGLAAIAPGTRVIVRDALDVMGAPVRAVMENGSSFHTPAGLVLSDLGHWLGLRFRPTSALGSWVLAVAVGRRLRRLVAAERPAAVVCTWPGATDVLGRLRHLRRLSVPVVSAVTDLAALRFWARPGVDLHLVIHPESEAEVRARAGRHTEVVAVAGFSAPGFRTPPNRVQARREIDLPADGKVIVVSGGGWAVGDLEGAVRVALTTEPAAVLVLCGRNQEVRARLAARFAGDARVRAWGFTDRMPSVLAAADALVHSTAGLTVLEALVLGVPVVSYGWGRAHIRDNNRAFLEHGLAAVAKTPAELRTALGRALTAPHRPYPDWPSWPTAAEEIARRYLPRG